MTNEDAGALSSQGRFQRMEEALARIEQKLDTKADAVRLEALEKHVSDLEAGRVITPSAQMYLTRFTELEKAVEAMEAKENAREAIQQAREKAASARQRWVSVTAAVAMIVNVIVGLAVTFSVLVK